MKKAVFGVMLTLLILASKLMLVLNIQTTGAWTGETIYIRADGSIDPPDAPIITYDNITYTLASNITSSSDGIVIERDNIVIDGLGYTLQGVVGAGIVLPERRNVTVKNINIEYFYSALFINNSSNNNIFGVKINGNGDGIRLVSSFSNNVSGNIIAPNSGVGVWLEYSSENIISGNNIADNHIGVELWCSSNNSILENVFIDNGLYVYSSYQNSVENNTVNGRPLVYLERASNYTVTNAGQVVLVRSENIRVENLDLLKATVGVELLETNNSIIYSNKIADNIYGVRLVSSFNNTIVENDILKNGVGIFIGYSSFCTVSRNDIKSHMYGVWLIHSSNNSIYENNVTKIETSYGVYGIHLEYCSNNNISGNNIENFLEGIGLGSVDNHIISGNNIAKSDWYAIWLGYSSSINKIFGNNVVNSKIGIYVQTGIANEIWHNNLIGNFKQVQLESYCGIIWYYDYPFGGNYWSDYGGIDNYSGIYQNETGSDGIGDTPYVIDAKNIDKYPLMKPWPSHDIAIINVTSSLSVATPGDSLIVNVTVINQGDFAENFNVTVYANMTLIKTEPMTNLQIRKPETLSFIWNTTEYTRGNYTISAYATPVQGETDIVDNTYVDGTVKIGIHDVAILNVTFSKEFPFLNETIFIYVPVQNQGDFTKTFDVSVNYTLLLDPLIGTQTVTLEPGQSITLNFTWTPNATGRYEIKAYTNVIPDDIDPSDNTEITYLYVQVNYTSSLSTEVEDWAYMNVRVRGFRYLAYSL